jgi:hypothetical protein
MKDRLSAWIGSNTWVDNCHVKYQPAATVSPIADAAEQPPQATISP